MEDCYESARKLIAEMEEVRKHKGISINALCKRADITVYTYYHWLEGKSNPSICNICVVLDVLGMKLEVVGKC